MPNRVDGSARSSDRVRCDQLKENASIRQNSEQVD